MRAHAQHLAGQGAALRWSALLTGTYFLIELAVGIATGSVAVLSDAFHTFSAVGGVVVAMAAARIAARSGSTNRTFGYFRAEIIGALVNGVFLFGMAILVLWMGVMRLRSPVDLPTGPMLWVALGGLVTEVISLWLLHSHQKADLNIKGAYWHVLQTFVGSFIIIIAALVIRFTGFAAIDPILGMVFGVVLLLASMQIMREAVHVLMEGAPRDIDLEELIRHLAAISHVIDIHHAHAWELTSGKAIFSSHLRVDEAADVADVLELTHAKVKDAGFYSATIQIETACLDEEADRDIDVVGKGT
ncbi:cation diffusion facilitator family transporter [Sphingomicrobium arenosum]|uniref:cation diffusion facilitator family transporter n=1 Tax=Sphingomicrobium arenosum TaxID=2233861 RepID=UPI00223F8398|nr:cation diffusion facilitator family transporter [Sphingomicrobium arenosum]